MDDPIIRPAGPAAVCSMFSQKSKNRKVIVYIYHNGIAGYTVLHNKEQTGPIRQITYNTEPMIQEFANHWRVAHGIEVGNTARIPNIKEETEEDSLDKLLEEMGQLINEAT